MYDAFTPSALIICASNVYSFGWELLDERKNARKVDQHTKTKVQVLVKDSVEEGRRVGEKRARAIFRKNSFLGQSCTVCNRLLWRQGGVKDIASKMCLTPAPHIKAGADLRHSSKRIRCKKKRYTVWPWNLRLVNCALLSISCCTREMRMLTAVGCAC